jgi:phosphoglycolate phosphatase-like HAD superfamily hydrolase
VSSRKLVLFDIDGTLTRGAGPHHKDALTEAARSVLKVDCTLEGVDTAGCLDTDLIRIMLANAGVPNPRISSAIKRVMEAAQHHYRIHCKADLTGKVCPGVTRALEMLAGQGIPLGLVTGNLSAIAWRKLRNAQLDGYFSFGAFAEEAKSRAALAKLAALKAKRIRAAAHRCSVTLIGDHANDIQAAKANGFRSIAVATGMMNVEQLSQWKPDAVLESLEGASIESICGT